MPSFTIGDHLNFDSILSQNMDNPSAFHISSKKNCSISEMIHYINSKYDQITFDNFKKKLLSSADNSVFLLCQTEHLYKLKIHAECSLFLNVCVCGF